MNENVQTVRRLYDYLRHRNVQGVLDLLADDIEWEIFGPRVIPFAGHWRGTDDVEKMFRSRYATTDQLELKLDSVASGTEMVTAVGHERVRARATGRAWDGAWVHVYWFRDGLIEQVREFADTAVMADAFEPRSMSASMTATGT